MVDDADTRPPHPVATGASPLVTGITRHVGRGASAWLDRHRGPDGASTT